MASRRIKKSPVQFGRGFFVSGQRLHDFDVGSLQTLRALFDGEFHLLAFLEIAEAFAFNCGVVNEHIRATLASEETITLVPIEPLDRTD